MVLEWERYRENSCLKSGAVPGCWCFVVLVLGWGRHRENSRLKSGAVPGCWCFWGVGMVSHWWSAVNLTFLPLWLGERAGLLFLFSVVPVPRRACPLPFPLPPSLARSLFSGSRHVLPGSEEGVAAGHLGLPGPVEGVVAGRLVLPGGACSGRRQRR